MVTKKKAEPKKEKKLNIEQLGDISTQGNQVEDKVREIVDWINSK